MTAHTAAVVERVARENDIPDITERLIESAVGMCACGSKSPDVQYHARRCPWRTHTDAYNEITRLRAALTASGHAEMIAALEAVFSSILYKTPRGAVNCRFCDRDMDDEGTMRDMHAPDCLVHEIRAALAKGRGEEPSR